MQNNNGHNDRDDIYDELKGFFPSEYDLTPEELEKKIRSADEEPILPETDAESEADRELDVDSVLDEIMSTAKVGNVDENVDADVVDDVLADVAEDDIADVAEDVIEDGITEPAAADLSASDSVTKADEAASETEWILPEAEPVTDNELLNKYPSLDELFDVMDTDNGPDADTPGDDSAIDMTATGDIPQRAAYDERAEAAVVSSGSETRKRLDWFFDFLEVFTICMACIILFFSFVARLTRVEGQSMEDTLHDGQYLVVSNLFYTPTKGDIVVLQNTSLSIDKLRDPLVKRIIAVGGDTVDITETGAVTVTDASGNAKVLDETYTKQEIYYKGAFHCTVPEGYVFVMGDNRNNSTDSRDIRVGLVDERCIFGHALFRVLPLGDATAFENPYKN